MTAGDRVELTIEGAARSRTVPAMVARMTPSRIVFSFPELGAPPAGLAPGSRIAIRLRGPSGPVLRHTVAIAVSASSPPTVEVGQFLAERAQRREFFRVDVALPVTCTPVGTNGAARGASAASGITENLSAGGLRLVTAERFAVRDLVRVRLELPSSLPGMRVGALEAEARVRRIGAVPGGPQPRYCLALQLVFDRESQQDQWVELAFALDRWVRTRAQAG